MSNPIKRQFRAKLLDLMYDLSDKLYDATWRCDLEFCLWKLILDGDTSDKIIQLKTLVESAGGWFVYWKIGPLFIPINKWLKIYAAGPDKAEEKIKEYVDFIYPQKRPSKWHKRRHKNGAKQQARSLRRFNRKQNNKKFRGEKTFAEIMAKPLKRMLGCESFARQIHFVHNMLE